VSGELAAMAVLLAIFGLLMIVSVLGSRSLERLGIPVVLLFLILGMLGGSEGLGRIPFDDYRFAFRLGTVALILILFDGGFNTSLQSIKASIRPAAALATIGVAGTAAAVAGFGRLLHMPWPEALLVGAVVSSTDAAAVFAVLRGGALRLRNRVGTTLELESGINDPMAVILTLAVIDAVSGKPPSAWSLVLGIPVQLAIGLIIGGIIGLSARALVQRVRLSTGGLYAVLTLALAFAAFGLAAAARGSGFLSVYVVAVLLGNCRLPYRAGLTRIHDAVAWLSQIAMFLVLGLLVFPSKLLPVARDGLAIGLFLAFAARPLITFLCLLPFGFSRTEKAYIGWVGLRGAVPVILATFPVLAGVPNGTHIFHIVFFVVVVNALIPGATIRFVTRRLGMEAPEQPKPLAALEINSTRLLHGEIMSFFISPQLAVCDARLSQIPFPANSAAILIVRGEELVAARGNTVLQPGDHVYVFCQPEDRAFIELLFGRPQGEE
jgi:cell volume regulation protein A